MYAVRYITCNGIWEVSDSFKAPNHVPFEAKDVVSVIYEMQTTTIADVLNGNSCSLNRDSEFL
jgi:hypothetical protein